MSKKFADRNLNADENDNGLIKGMFDMDKFETGKVKVTHMQ